MRNPVFIGGLERSGKTYMRMMLAAHPHMAFSHRTNLWTFHYNRYGDLNKADNLERCLTEMMRSKHIRVLFPDFARIKRDLGTAPVTYADLFALIHEHYAEQLGKPRWGDQTEFIERFASEIFSAYPGARIIHMLRDPRDRYEATLHKPHRRGGLGVAIARWRTSAALAQKNQRDYPGRYKVIRYETMVMDPEATLRDVCVFLDEIFHPEMLQLKGESRFSGRAADEEGGMTGPLSTEYIGRFKKGLSSRAITFAQKYAGDLMPGYGYPLTPVRFSWQERLRFLLLDDIFQSLHMAGWRLLSALGKNGT